MQLMSQNEKICRLLVGEEYRQTKSVVLRKSWPISNYQLILSFDVEPVLFPVRKLPDIF